MSNISDRNICRQTIWSICKIHKHFPSLLFLLFVVYCCLTVHKDLITELNLRWYFKAVGSYLRAPWCGSVRRVGLSCSHCPSRRPSGCWPCRCCCTAAAAPCGRTRRPPSSSWPFTSDTPWCQRRHVHIGGFRPSPGRTQGDRKSTHLHTYTPIHTYQYNTTHK